MSFLQVSTLIFSCYPSEPINEGYAVSMLVTDATMEFLGAFPGGVHGFVSVAAARCWKSAAPKDGNPCAKSHFAVLLENGSVQYLSPAFDPKTALKNNTVTWSEVIRSSLERYAGRPMFALITPDFKKRLWHFARSGVLGAQTPVYVHHVGSGMSGQFTVNWSELANHVVTIEMLLELGFSKQGIGSSLLSAPRKVIEAVGLQETLSLERQIAPFRDCVEFRIAVITAARYENKPSSSEPKGVL
jgi:hypothetical protein